VGETLIDETRLWSLWADVLGIPRLTFMSAFGAVIARGGEHRGVFELVARPDWQDLMPRVQAEYGGFQLADLYPDALRSLAVLREAGYRIAIVANQPIVRTAELRAIGVDADVVAMSDELGVWKPDPAFFATALALMDEPDPSDVIYVGDRIDNDVLPAAAAGMRAVWLRRGPWGVIERTAPPQAALVIDSLDELVKRIAECWTPRVAEAAPGTEKSSTFRLTIVGCAPAYALRPGHAASCYLVESRDEGILLDMGQGAFATLGAYREPLTLRAVVVSHLHPDHMIDLVPLRHYLRYGLDRPRSVALHGPAQLRARIGALMGEAGFLDDLPGHDLKPGTIELGALRVEARPVTHALNSFGFRVTRAEAPEEAPGLVYSGDCGRPEDILVLVRPGDTMLCEASWGSSETVAEEAAHLTARQAAEVARDGGAARLVLTHILDAYDPEGAAVLARTVFAGIVELATPGLVVDLG